MTTVTELAEVLHNLPDPAAAAVRVKKNLQSIFETRYSFEIEDMVKMNQGKAIQEVGEARRNQQIRAWLYDPKFTRRSCDSGQRFDYESSRCDRDRFRSRSDQRIKHPGLERTIAKSKGLEFSSCLHQFAVDCQLQPHEQTNQSHAEGSRGGRTSSEKGRAKAAPKPEKTARHQSRRKENRKSSPPHPSQLRKRKPKTAPTPTKPPVKPTTKSAVQATAKPTTKPAEAATSKTPTKSPSKSVEKVPAEKRS